MKVGKHSLLKEMNRRIVLQFISNQSLSCNDIVNKSGLSYTGIVTLIDEMVDEKLVVKRKGTDASGRKSVVFSINPKFGLFFIVKLIDKCSVIMCALDGSEICEEDLSISGKVKMSDMERAVEIMKSLLKKYPSYGQLFRITIIASGKINKHDGSFMHAPAFENYQNMNLYEYFKDAFNVETDIKNDIRFSLIAEKSLGENSDRIVDTLYLQVGTGIGSALFLNGKLYEGNSGLNGEIGYFIVDALTNSSNYLMSNTSNYYMSHASYSHIVDVVRFALSKNVESVLSGKEDITIGDIAEAYKRDDKLCCDVVNATIAITASMLKSLAEVLDFSNVIISRKTMFFGEKYISVLKNMLAQFTEISNVDVFLSTYDIEGVVIGAKQYAMDRIISVLSKKSGRLE